jgi:putative transposase
VDAATDLLTVYRDIELDPVRANMVRHAAGYSWSSDQANALGKPITLLTPDLALPTTRQLRKQATARLPRAILWADGRA